jgi:hypothetical protein
MTADERSFDEYEFDPEITEAHGFTIGDMVFVTEELEDAEDTGIFRDDSGQVVGFSVIPPATDPGMALAFGNDPKGRTAMYVLFDGTDAPVEVKPTQVEAE